MENYDWKRVWNQYYAAIAANSIFLDQGCIIGWISPAIPKLLSPETPLLSGPLTQEQSSWIGSINCLGSSVGYIIFGILTHLIGCKQATCLLIIPSFATWIWTFFGENYYDLLIARFCGGLLTGGSASTVILFVSEISNDSIRGRLGSISMFARNVGILIAYILASTVDYKYIPCICILTPIIFAISFTILPNTPHYYLHKEKPIRAENALKYYKRFKGDSKHEQYAFDNEFERLKMIAAKRKTDDAFKITDFCNSNVMKSLGISIAIILIQQFTGNFLIICYAVTIFQKTGTPLDPYVSSMITGVALLLGSLLSTYLADVLGRKLLNIMSLIGSAFGLFATAFYKYLQLNGYDLSAYAWTPVICLSFVIFVSSAGITPLSTICCLEYIPPKIRTFGMTIIGLFNSQSGFVTIKTFPLLLTLFDLHGSLFIYGSGCILGAIFIFIVTKETSGQRIDDGDAYASGKKTGSNIQIDLFNKAHCPLIAECKE